MGSGTSSASRPGEAPGGLPPGTALQQLVAPPAADAAATEELAVSLDVWKVLTHANKEHARRLAIVDCAHPASSDPEQCANITTYGQLYDHVLGLAGHLASLGVGRGSRVAVMLRNCAEVRPWSIASLLLCWLDTCLFCLSCWDPASTFLALLAITHLAQQTC
jgi:acyl-CoA synthetase (AMP-forming)/AMP-acid ligase II